MHLGCVCVEKWYKILLGYITLKTNVLSIDIKLIADIALHNKVRVKVLLLS